MTLKDRHRRSIVKAVTFRIVATLATIIIVYLVTGNLKLSGLLGGLDLISKFILYDLHERIWEGISWGKKEA